MILLDISIRAAAIALALLSATALMIVPQTRPVGRPVTALALTMAGYALLSSLAAPGFPPAIIPALLLAAIFVPLAVCWLVVTLFLDDPRDRLPWLVAAGIAVALAIAGIWVPGLEVGRGLVMLAFFVALLGMAIRTAKEDLVEDRLKFRPAFLSAIAILGVSISSTELIFGYRSVPDAMTLAQGLAFLALAFAYALWVLKPEPKACICFTEPVKPVAPVDRRAEAVDGSVVSALKVALDSGIWRREGLTIAALGAEIGVPEHRLRAVINRRLGFRNFPTFINSYRIAAAKQVLADPGEARRTILEIAYDVGFASLGPFNKAFRDQTGESPSEFRRRALDSGQPLAGFEKSPSLPESERLRPH
jgi:AraC-like DNA-binding protein